MEKTHRKCIFAGTFDPPTIGHKSMIEDCLKIFDEVVVALLVNPQKKPYFSLTERKEMLGLMFPSQPKIRVIDFSGTVAELLKEENTSIYVRGVRNATDLDYENANFYASKKLNEDVTAVYLPCRQEYLHISSSMARNCLRFGMPLDEYVTEEVKTYILSRKKAEETKEEE